MDFVLPPGQTLLVGKMMSLPEPTVPLTAGGAKKPNNRIY
jgi:hypothetical protein